mmetsp:Transcript_119834/g.211847  ORF Transcript_119834/g.211847 Transcript_119834/m.211847 type:complete len:136 (+) Transcript_119834:324-731(+)
MMTPAPIQEPCGILMGDPVLGGNDAVIHATLFDLNTELVRCLVPKERLFEIDVWSETTDDVMPQLSAFLNLPPMNAEYPHCSGGCVTCLRTLKQIFGFQVADEQSQAQENLCCPGSGNERVVENCLHVNITELSS